MGHCELANLPKRVHLKGSMNQFKKYLFEKYDGFRDKRVKDIAKDYSFKIDDQAPEDNKELFCGIFVRVVKGTTFELHLTNNAPLNSIVKKLIESKGGEVNESVQSSIKVELSCKDYEFILKLSNEIKGLVAPDKQYSNPNWKWLCPRTANSLTRFAEILTNYDGKEITKRGFFW